MDYLVPYQYGEAEFVEKRSRFIGQVWPVESEEQAKALIAETKSKYHDARHNCWCYIIRSDGKSSAGVIRYADDGEPQGTAGQPMLELFRWAGIENVLCVVTRYFGGILLGTGGLTRVYANTAKLALEAAGIAEMRLWTCMDIVCPYSLLDSIKNEIDQFGGKIENADYGTDVSLSAIFPAQTVTSFEKRLADLSAGTVNGVVTGAKHIAVPIK
ncbi:MAG: YigZ family protein [Clostridiales bacterium]|nr:YigZ family protein [Clostridiales bacterium]